MAMFNSYVSLPEGTNKKRLKKKNALPRSRLVPGPPAKRWSRPGPGQGQVHHSYFNDEETMKKHGTSTRSFKMFMILFLVLHMG